MTENDLLWWKCVVSIYTSLSIRGLASHNKYSYDIAECMPAANFHKKSLAYGI